MPFEQIIEYISGPYCYPAFFTLMIFCGLGFPLNSDLVLLFVGSLSGTGVIDPLLIIPLAVLGMGIGDSLAFFIGRYGGFRVLKRRPFNLILSKEKIWRAGRFVRRKGPGVIFLVRFLPGTRTVTFFTAGVFKMDYSKFIIRNLSAISILSTILVFGGNKFVSNLNEAKENLPYLLVGMFTLASFFYLMTKVFVKRTMVENYSLSSEKLDQDPKKEAC